jgi:hypothetical protein
VIVRSQHLLTISAFAALVVAACAGPAPSASWAAPADDSVLLPLELRVRNSGLPGGYLWMSVVDQPGTGRWHRFGMADFFCATCPVPFAHVGAAYEIAVLDESCQLRAAQRTIGGKLQVEIDLGPTIKLVEAPPLGDWIPGDSPPADPGSIPCSPP